MVPASTQPDLVSHLPLTRRSRLLLPGALEFAAPMPALRGLARFSYGSVHEAAAMGSFDFLRLPEGLVQIGLFVTERAGRQLSRLYVSGPHDRPLPHPFPPSTCRVLGLEFEAGATFGMLGVPLVELAGAPIPLEDIWGPPARILAERLEACTSLTAGLELLQAELIGRKLRSDDGEGSRQAGAALRSVQESNGSIRIGKLASDLGVSDRQLRRLFADHVGLSPKRYAQITRFRHALGFASSSSPVDWALMAVELGYTDQSHLIEDFRDQLGSTPERLRLHADFIEELAHFGLFVTPKLAAAGTLRDDGHRRLASAP